jgi:SH3-like domain-containing protein
MFRKNTLLALLAACLFLSPGLALAGKDEASGEGALPVPRFVTLGTDEINLRTGPGLRYPIRIVVRKDGLPVEVIREFDVWRQVRDAEGDEGWVHKSMLSGKRAVVVRGTTRVLMKTASSSGKPLAKVEPGVVARLKTCAEEWCAVTASGYAGFLKRADLWGVYPGETFGKD